MMSRRVADGTMSPRGFAIAWRDYARREGVAYPVGLHLFAKVARRAWFRLVVYRPDWLEAELARAYEQGRREGETAGWDSFYRSALAQLDRR